MNNLKEIQKNIENGFVDRPIKFKNTLKTEFDCFYCGLILGFLFAICIVSCLWALFAHAN